MVKRSIPFLLLAGMVAVFGCGGDSGGPVEPKDPQCGLSTTTLNFGNVQIGNTKDLTVSVTNVGGGTLVDTLKAGSCPDFAIVGDAGFSLAAGASKTLTIRFTANSLGQKNCSFTFAQGDCGGIAAAGTVVGRFMAFVPSKDNTLYETTDQEWSNGQGFYLFVGRTSSTTNEVLRRAVMKFDLGALPSNAIVDSVRLEVTVSRVPTVGNAPQPMTLHRLTTDWGEGSSKAIGNEGGGTDPATGDATWSHTFFNTQFWNTPGGDFVAATSDSTTLNGLGPYELRGDGLADDVTFWLANPASNFGWILLGNESAVPKTAKRLNSRNVGTPPSTTPPTLTVYYSTP